MSTPTTPADVAAPLDSLLVQAAHGPYRRFVPDASTAKFAADLLRHPRRTSRRVADLARELARIGVGTSTTAPSRRDRRFTDPAWTQNPLLRRLVQSYLATGQAAQALVTDADLSWRDAERVSFLVDNLVEAPAPSNVPLVNPSSAKAAIDTGGMSLVRGGQTMLRDLASAPRVPEMVDGSGFELGSTIAATPGDVVHRTEIAELIRYRPQTEQVRQVPLLIVPPTINKYYALDLAPGRSLVEYLVQHGQQVYVISWRNPDARHADWGLDTYVQAVLDTLDTVQRVAGTDRAALTGVFWNADTTRMAARLHADFVDFGLQNTITRPGAISVLGSPVDPSQLKVDAYLIAGSADHITPWQNCYRSAALLGGDTRFVLSTSGHIAALVNPPTNTKAGYQTNDENPPDPQQWQATAQTHKASWWPDYSGWLADRCGPAVAAPDLLGEPLAPAPGTYVFEK